MTESQNDEAKPKKPKKPRKAYEVLVPPTTTINPYTGRTYPLIPANFKPQAQVSIEEVRLQAQIAYELIGGVSRFALWADENPTEYYKLYFKCVPPEETSKATTAIQINLNGGGGIPQSSLNDVELRDETIVNAKWHEAHKDDDAL